MVFDEEKGEWVAKWGYKGANKAGEGDWLVEVDEKDNDDGGVKLNGKGEGGEGGPRNGSKVERRERVKRNERRMRANEKRARRADR